MSRVKYDLLVVAHPDDETIFFGGLLQARQARPWKVICVTDANADGMGLVRHGQFLNAMKELGIRDAEQWDYPDVYERRLQLDDLSGRLRALPTPHTVFTHGIIGEYMHPHHQDVSFCVHHAFEGHPRLYSTAYNAFPELTVRLTKKQFEKKSRILTKIYGSETSRFLNLLPSTWAEGFVRADLREVDTIYRFLSEKRPLNKKYLSHYAWLVNFVKNRPAAKRPF